MTTWMSQICRFNMPQTKLFSGPKSLDWYCLHSLPSRKLEVIFLHPYFLSCQLPGVENSFSPFISSPVLPHFRSSSLLIWTIPRIFKNALSPASLFSTGSSQHNQNYFPPGWMKSMLHGKAHKTPCHLSCLSPVTFIFLMFNNTEQVAFH